MSDNTAIMEHPGKPGETREAEGGSEELVQLMVAGWRQVVAPSQVKATVQARPEEG